MQLPIDRQSTQPIYLQIRERLRRLIQSGRLQPGEKLPSIRKLAKTVQVSPLTVIEAYGLLEGDNLIQSRPGSGYFVRPATPPVSDFAPAQAVIIQDQETGGFCQQFLASLQAQVEGKRIDFSSGFPQLWDLGDLQKMARRALAQNTEALFHYGFPQGQPLLQQQIAQLLVQQGLEVSAHDLILTNGSQQALALAMGHYVRPGDWVIVEAPLGARIVGIPMTATTFHGAIALLENGMNLDLLEQYLHSHRPRLIYTISTLHNPTGLTTSQAHRQRLLALANRYDCPIIEDNAYEGLHFEPVPPPLKAIDTDHRVTYIGTFTKTLIPGLRVGYMVATGAAHQQMLRQKLLHDFHVSTVSQAIVSEYLASGRYRRHLQQLRSHHLHSRDVMLQALERYFPKPACWTVPRGGLFLWVQLPEAVALNQVCEAAFAEGVLIANGTAFFPGQRGYPALRLNYSHSPDAIETGIQIVGNLLHRHLA